MNGIAFRDHVRRTVDEFLQTVVMVDDEAYRVAPQPDSDAWDADDAPGPRPVRRTRLRAPAVPPAADDLDPRATTEAFGRRGLACAMLSPQTEQENREVKDPLVATARRADLVVLDWNLNGDDGATTLRLFEEILRSDSGDVSRRLRVVAVYTGEPKLVAIDAQMRAAATKAVPGEAVEPDEDGSPQFTCGPVRVAVLAKEHVRSLPNELEQQRLAIPALPERLRDEFCRLCFGLVPTAAVAALAGIRDESHRLLRAMGAGLDPALLGQRVALDQPEEAERQLEALLAAEITAIVSDREVGKHAGFPRIRDWLDSRAGLPVGGTHASVTAAQRLGFVKIGLGDAHISEQAVLTSRSKTDLRRLRHQATGLFTSSPAEAQDANRALAERMVVRTRYSKPSPVLRLGTVLERDGEYVLCVQPVCDSVRLTDPTQFPLLRLEPCGPDDTGDGIIALRDPGKGGGWQHLKIVPNASALRLETFVPGASRVVRARVSAGQPRFVRSSGGTWRWVADLKAEHAQRAAEQLGSSLSRVGLTDPELLRLPKPQ